MEPFEEFAEQEHYPAEVVEAGEAAILEAAEVAKGHNSAENLNEED